MKSILPLFLLLLLSQTSKADYWTAKAAYSGGATTGASAFSIGGKGYICGPSTSFWEYDPVTDLWTQMAAFIGLPRTGAAGFSIGTKGYIGTGGSYNDFYEWSQTTNTWTAKADFGGSAREGASGIAINGKGYIGLGGNYMNDWWEYDTTANTWTVKANLTGNGRYHAGAFAIGNFGYVCAGFNGSTGSAFYNDLWEYDAVNDSWSQMANLPGMVRDRPVGFSIGTKGYIGTGWTGSILSDFYEWDQGTNTWQQKADLLPARYDAIGFSIGTKGYIGTGVVNGGSTADLWEYTPDSVLTGLHEASPGHCNVSFFPNPMSDKATFTIHTTEKILHAELKIFNEAGQVVRELRMNGPSVLITRKNLESGIYFFRLIEYGNPVESAAGKFIIE